MIWAATTLALLCHAQLGNTGRQAYLRELQEAYFVKLPELVAENSRLERSQRQTIELIASLEARHQRLTGAVQAQRSWHEVARTACSRLEVATALHAAWGPRFAAEAQALVQPWAGISTAHEVDAAWRELLFWQGRDRDEHRVNDADSAAAEALRLARDRLLAEARLLLDGPFPSEVASPLASESGRTLQKSATALVEAAAACEEQRVLVASLRFVRRRLRDDLEAAMRAALHRRFAAILVREGTDALQSASTRTAAGQGLSSVHLEFATDNEHIARLITSGQCTRAQRALRIARHRVEDLATWSARQNWPLDVQQRLERDVRTQRSRLGLLGATLGLWQRGSCQ